MRPAPSTIGMFSPLAALERLAVDGAVEIHGDAIGVARFALDARERRPLLAQVLDHRVDVRGR